jgi:hypothetical protein
VEKVEGYTEHDFCNIFSIPFASEYSQWLSEFERRFANSDVYEEAALMFARLDNETLGISLLRKQCLMQEESLKDNNNSYYSHILYLISNILS